jgi:lactate permease
MGCYQRGAARRILGSTLRRVLPSSVSILSMIAMALIMEYSGMTDILARSLAEGAGGLFPFLSPWIGAVGAFMTGSNTNSNVVFGVLQMQTAELLHAPVALILAAQTASAGLASVAAPAKIVVGASTTSMAGQEGEVLRRLAGYTILFVTLIGVLAWLGVQLSAWLGV